MSEEHENKNQELAQEAVALDIAAGGAFVAAVQHTRMPIVFSDPKLPGNPIIFANDSFLALTGYERDEVLGQNYHFMMGEATDPDARAQIENAFEEGVGATYPEVRYCRKDGTTFWAILFVGPVLNEHHAVIQHFASFLDVTRRKQDEERLRLMLAELDHRVKNSLTTLQALARQSLSGSAVDKQVRDAFEGRILALSKGHRLLAQENWEGANLREVIELIIEPFQAGPPEKPRFSLLGDDTAIGSKAALGLAMMTYELANNAAKYGALSEDSGQIEIIWSIVSAQEEKCLELRWQEHGGPSVLPPDRKGFGSRLIERMLALEIGAETKLSYEPAGVICELKMPITADRRWA